MPVQFVVVEDLSNAWGMGPPAFDREQGRPDWTSSSLEEGPTRRIWTQTAIWNSSKITVELIETHGDPILEIGVFVDWHERQQILMLEIPTALATRHNVAKTIGGEVHRESTGSEEVGQDWVALEGSIGGGTHSVGLLNAQTYSYNYKDVAADDRRAVGSLDLNFDHNVFQDQGHSSRRLP